MTQVTSGVRACAESPSAPQNPVVQRVWAWTSVCLSWAILGLGLWTALFTAKTVRHTYSPVIFWDQWEIIDNLYWDEHHNNGAFYTKQLWVLHNEHRIVTGRLAELADIKFFGGRSVSLLIEIYLVQLA